jgi:hypothetical protein
VYYSKLSILVTNVFKQNSHSIPLSLHHCFVVGSKYKQMEMKQFCMLYSNLRLQPTVEKYINFFLLQFINYSPQHPHTLAPLFCAGDYKVANQHRSYTFPFHPPCSANKLSEKKRKEI